MKNIPNENLERLFSETANEPSTPPSSEKILDSDKEKENNGRTSPPMFQEKQQNEAQEEGKIISHNEQLLTLTQDRNEPNLEEEQMSQNKDDKGWINTKSRKKKKLDVGGNSKVGRPQLKETRVKETTKDVVARKHRTLDSLVGNKPKRK